MKRKLWLWLYKLGIYKAPLVGDGYTDNSRALQARLDAGEYLFPDEINGGTYYIGERVYTKLPLTFNKGIEIIGMRYEDVPHKRWIDENQDSHPDSD